MDGSPNKPLVALLADQRNEPAAEALPMRFSRAPDFAMNATELLGDTFTQKDLEDRLTSAPKVAIVAVGVEGLGSYETKLFSLLDHWKNLPDKPVLLFMTYNPANTANLIAKWEAATQLPERLKPALRVNTQYLLSGQSAKTDIQQALAVAQELSPELSTPPELVLAPDILGNTAARGRKLG